MSLGARRGFGAWDGDRLDGDGDGARLKERLAKRMVFVTMTKTACISCYKMENNMFFVVQKRKKSPKTYSCQELFQMNSVY